MMFGIYATSELITAVNPSIVFLLARMYQRVYGRTPRRHPAAGQKIQANSATTGLLSGMI